jgi:hypothetical protein
MIVANLLSENVQVKRRPLLDRVDSKDQFSTGSFKTRARSEDAYPLKRAKRSEKHLGITSPRRPEALFGRLVKTLPIFSS